MRGASAGLGYALLACSAGPPVSTAPPVLHEPAPRLRSAAYDLRWGAALIGDAVERDDGARFTRHERVVVRRGDAVVVDELELAIDRRAGHAHTVTLDRWRDGAVSRGRAEASATGWIVSLDGEPDVALAPATPFEDAVASAAATGGFRGRVLLAGYGFAVADLTIAPEAAGDGWLATLALDGGGALAAHIAYGSDGLADEIRGGDGVSARRRGLGAPAPRFVPIEVVVGSAIEIVGGAARELAFPDAAAAPPALPGQRIVTDADGWHLVLDADAPGDLAPEPLGPDRTRAIAALTDRVAVAIVDDLGATANTIGAARVADRGDCTTHALRFAAEAAEVGIATRVVTGLRVDGALLVRHRWIVAWTGARWIAVDPTYDESPAAPLLVGLAVHGVRAAELALADAVVFDRLGARAAGFR